MLASCVMTNRARQCDSCSHWTRRRLILSSTRCAHCQVTACASSNSCAPSVRRPSASASTPRKPAEGREQRAASRRRRRRRSGSGTRRSRRCGAARQSAALAPTSTTSSSLAGASQVTCRRCSGTSPEGGVRPRRPSPPRTSPPFASSSAATRASRSSTGRRRTQRGAGRSWGPSVSRAPLAASLGSWAAMACGRRPVHHGHDHMSCRPRASRR